MDVHPQDTDIGPLTNGMVQRYHRHPGKGHQGVSERLVRKSTHRRGCLQSITPRLYWLLT